MNRNAFIQRLARKLELLPSIHAGIRAFILRVRGANVGKGTRIPYGTICPWPHQLRLGTDCILQPDIFFNYDDFWKPGPSLRFGNRVFIGRGCEFNISFGLDVGDDCLIASGCTFVDANHGMLEGRPMNLQPIQGAPMRLGENVWIGAQSIVLKGVEIGANSIVGAGSIVTKSIPSGEVWAGAPAERIKSLQSRQE